MRYELFFWGMLAVVATAAIGGILSGWIRSIRTMLLATTVLSACVAALVAVLHLRAEMTDGIALSIIASFLFSAVISAAFALLTRRILLRASVS